MPWSGRIRNYMDEIMAGTSPANKGYLSTLSATAARLSLNTEPMFRETYAYLLNASFRIFDYFLE